VGLDYGDIENMTVGACLDFIEEYVKQKSPEEEKQRQASQKDMDFF